MKTKAIIFDLDGVLVFTDMFHYKAWKKIADKKDIYFDETINDRLRGVSRMESLDIILEKYDGTLTDEEKNALADEKNEFYKEYLKELTPSDVTDDVRATLKKLKEKGYLIAIGSSSKNAKYILEKVELINEFDAISDGNNIVNTKPDPEVFLMAAEYLGVPARECAVVEDAWAGIDAALAAGMIAFGIGSAADYEKCDYKIENLNDMMEILD